jgi:hypothetical protein
MDKSELPAFFTFRDGVMAQIAKIPYRTAEEIAATKETVAATKP